MAKAKGAKLPEVKNEKRAEVLTPEQRMAEQRRAEEESRRVEEESRRVEEESRRDYAQATWENFARNVALQVAAGFIDRNAAESGKWVADYCKAFREGLVTDKPTPTVILGARLHNDDTTGKIDEQTEHGNDVDTGNPVG